MFIFNVAAVDSMIAMYNVVKKEKWDREMVLELDQLKFSIDTYRKEIVT